MQGLDIFTARQHSLLCRGCYAEHCTIVNPSPCPSVFLSVTRWHWVNMTGVTKHRTGPKVWDDETFPLKERDGGRFKSRRNYAYHF